MLKMRKMIKRYLYGKIKDLSLDEKYMLLSQTQIAAEELKSEMNVHCVYCERCHKHFLKSSCKKNVVEETRVEYDNEHDIDMFAKQATIKNKILYRVCPECGKDDLYDTIIQTTIT